MAHSFQLKVKGQEKITIQPSTGTSTSTSSIDGNATSVMDQRTKGQLPAPHIFHESSSSKLVLLSYPNIPDLPISNGDDTSNGNMLQAKLYAPHQMALAIRFQRLQLQHTSASTSTINDDYESIVHLQCLDLESIYFETLSRISGKKLIQVVDLTCLRHLERLSVKGCSKLKVLRVPHCLRALDASACTELREIVMGNMYLGDEYDGTSVSTATSSYGGTGALSAEKDNTTRRQSNNNFLTALNLNGCRSLTKASFFAQGFLTNVLELDMTSVTKLSTDLIVEGFSCAQSLRNISLRHMATDAMLHALAKADIFHGGSDMSAGTGTGTGSSTVGMNNCDVCISNGSTCVPPLMLVDLSFSHVTDGPLEELVRRAKKLERCNLRGCKGISGSCYNQVPIHLSKVHVGVEDQEFAIDYGSDDRHEQKKKRKGDNIFFFVS